LFFTFPEDAHRGANAAGRGAGGATRPTYFAGSTDSQTSSTNLSIQVTGSFLVPAALKCHRLCKVEMTPGRWGDPTRPQLLPELGATGALARSRPSLVRARIRSRSNSARPPSVLTHSGDSHDSESVRSWGYGVWGMAAMAQQVCVVLSTAEREQLMAIAADRNRPRKHIERARIVLTRRIGIRRSGWRNALALVGRRCGDGNSALPRVGLTVCCATRPASLVRRQLRRKSRRGWWR